jgi:DNA-binding MarR family transcriptional regulator
MVERFERFSYFISELSRCLHRLADEEMRKYELKGSYAIYFTTLLRSSGITAAQLAEMTGRDKADVSRTIAVLEKKGLVTRQAGYRANLQLTQSGIELSRALSKRVSAAVAYAGKDLSEEDRNTFYACMESLVQNLQTLSLSALEV